MLVYIIVTKKRPQWDSTQHSTIASVYKYSVGDPEPDPDLPAPDPLVRGRDPAPDPDPSLFS